MENILIRWTHGRPEHSYPVIVISSCDLCSYNEGITVAFGGGGVMVSSVVWGFYEKIFLRYGDITITGDGHIYLTLIAI